MFTPAVLMFAGLLLLGFGTVIALILLRGRAEASASPELIERLARLEALQGQAAPQLQGELRGLREEIRTALAEARREAAENQARFAEQLKASTESFAQTQRQSLGDNANATKALADKLESQLKQLLESDERRQAMLRDTLTQTLDKLREGNEKKLDEMRGVVDEKLSATLETRLGEKFKTVSEHLEAVHKGLGEMQSLATGVGDLKRVLTNVRSRGAWGELRLGQLLEDILPGQYEAQVQVRAGTSERVDFAVKLPGKGEAPVWLPIDCKFPQEDYERLQAAQELGDPAEVEACATALDRAIRIQAKSIAAKYVHPPQTTPFAFLYLPTEGLYAEAIRRPGLVSDLQTQLGVLIAGPSTLTANLVSLQVGFKSLAVEKRAAEVWTLLGEAKAEFRKYGEVWSKLGEKLDQAKDLHEKVATRSRAVQRKLRGVEEIEAAAGTPALLEAAAELDAEDEAA